jgi:hypothetical protein
MANLPIFVQWYPSGVGGEFFHIEVGIIFGKPFGQVVREALEVYVIPMPAEVPVDNFGQFLLSFPSKHDYRSTFLLEE